MNNTVEDINNFSKSTEILLDKLEECFDETGTNDSFLNYKQAFGLIIEKHYSMGEGLLRRVQIACRNYKDEIYKLKKMLG